MRCQRLCLSLVVVVVRINGMYKLIGAIGGGLLGLLIPFLLMLIYAAAGDDPTAAGAFSFFPIATIPLGIVGGWKIGGIIQLIKKSKE